MNPDALGAAGLQSSDQRGRAGIDADLRFSINLSMKLENRMNIPCVTVRDLFVITFFALLQSVTADIRYNIVGIGDYQNTTPFMSIEGMAMNNLGEAVGMYYDPSDGSRNAFRWSDTGFQIVQGLSSLSRINDNGQMIGQNIYGSYFYSQGTGLVPLSLTARYQQLRGDGWHFRNGGRAVFAEWGY
jgi:hypothetical protein